MSSRPLATAVAIAAVLGLAAHAYPEGSKRSPDGPGPGQGEGRGGRGEGRGARGEDKLEKATFGGGCFWCLEAVFERIPGVKSVVSGYAGGTVPRPTYEMVSSGLTGHAEVVQIAYDPEVVSFEKLLETFWECHDPTTLNRQGPDFGTQYRSIILYHNEAQKQAAQESYEVLTAAGVFAESDRDPARPAEGLLSRRSPPPGLLPQEPQRGLLPDVHRPQAHEVAGQEGKLPVLLNRQAVTSPGTRTRLDSACSAHSQSLPSAKAPRRLRLCKRSPRRSWPSAHSSRSGAPSPGGAFSRRARSEGRDGRHELHRHDAGEDPGGRVRDGPPRVVRGAREGLPEVPGTLADRKKTPRIEELTDQAPHKVRITRPFYMGAHEVTIGQFRRFVEEPDYETEPERDGTGGYGVDLATKEWSTGRREASIRGGIPASPRGTITPS